MQEMFDPGACAYGIKIYGLDADLQSCIWIVPSMQPAKIESPFEL
jgi:hypothetical protein